VRVGSMTEAVPKLNGVHGEGTSDDEVGIDCIVQNQAIFLQLWHVLSFQKFRQYRGSDNFHRNCKFLLLRLFKNFIVHILSSILNSNMKILQ
jgi:hypothetical protein